MSLKTIILSNRIPIMSGYEAMMIIKMQNDTYDVITGNFKFAS